MPLFVMTSAAGLAMIGALFGVGMARMLWAYDLKHAQQLRDNWDKSKAAMEQTIAAKDRTIDILQKHLDLYRGQGK